MLLPRLHLSAGATVFVSNSFPCHDSTFIYSRGASAGAMSWPDGGGPGSFCCKSARKLAAWCFSFLFEKHREESLPESTEYLFLLNVLSHKKPWQMIHVVLFRSRFLLLINDRSEMITSNISLQGHLPLSTYYLFKITQLRLFFLCPGDSLPKTYCIIHSLPSFFPSSLLVSFILL